MNVVTEQFKWHNRISIVDDDILSIERLISAPKQQCPDKQKIVFRLRRKELKKDIQQVCRRFRLPFYVNGSLVPVRSSIHYVLRQENYKLSFQDKIHRSNYGNVCVFLPTSRH